MPIQHAAITIKASHVWRESAAPVIERSGLQLEHGGPCLTGCSSFQSCETSRALHGARGQHLRHAERFLLPPHLDLMERLCLPVECLQLERFFLPVERLLLQRLCLPVECLWVERFDLPLECLRVERFHLLAERLWVERLGLPLERLRVERFQICHWSAYGWSAC